MKYLISGGGTGGHIYPALAIANEIKKRDKNAEIIYIGTKDGLEA
ncbi:MAG TPA: glycosyltransferase, partial [Tissierellaceae bacterium]